MNPSLQPSHKIPEGFSPTSVFWHQNRKATNPVLQPDLPTETYVEMLKKIVDRENLQKLGVRFC